MAINGRNKKINWLTFFKLINSEYSRLTIISGLIGLGYAAGYFSSNVINGRELIKMERELNNVTSELNSIKIQFERERSDLHLEINDLKLKKNNILDSLNRNEGKK